MPGTGTDATLSRNARLLVLAVAFFGWFFAGMHMSIVNLGSRPAATDLLTRSGQLDARRFREFSQQARADKAKGTASLSDGDKSQLVAWESAIGRWYAWYNCAFLFGAATGGLVFGWLGDRIGRAKGMSVSILVYSTSSALAYFSQVPWQLFGLWFLIGTGVGGTWPNGVALVSEAWSNMSRPMVAGIIGTAANVGQFLFAITAQKVAISPDDWRWTLILGAGPFVLGIVSLLSVPESPQWLAARNQQKGRQATNLMAEVFRPPLLTVTLLGIVLATIPLFGGWGTANWMVPWADQAGMADDPPNPHLKADVLTWRSFTGSIGSLLGGWVASSVGRRQTYSLVSIVSLAIAQFTFWTMVPTDRGFLWAVGTLGFFSGIYFGWLPLFLPELYPTRVRSTGAGVSFNFGRILTASTLFATGAVMAYFEGDYARIGRVTSLLFILGIFIVWLAPDTSRKQLEN